jgi:hypothetical protein
MVAGAAPVRFAICPPVQALPVHEHPLRARGSAPWSTCHGSILPKPRRSGIFEPPLPQLRRLLCRPPAVRIRELTECGCYGSDRRRVFRPRPARAGAGLEVCHFRMSGSLSKFCPCAPQIVREFRRQGYIRDRGGRLNRNHGCRSCGFSLKKTSKAHFCSPSDSLSSPQNINAPSNTSGTSKRRKLRPWIRSRSYSLVAQRSSSRHS